MRHRARPAVTNFVLFALLWQAAPAADRPPSPESIKQFRAAVEYLKRGQPDAAEPILRSLCDRYPGEPDFHEALGMLYSLKREPERAAAYLENALRLRPSAPAYTNLAANYAERGRDEDAGAALGKALAMEPGNLAANFNLAGLYLKKEDFAQALPLLQRVVRARPAAPEPAYLLAVCYSALGRPARARGTLLSVPLKSRDREEIQLLLGSTALSLGRRTEAQVHYQRALKLNPDSVQAAANLGALLVSGGSVEQGLEMLETAWRRDATSYLAGYNLALAYKLTGNLEAARSVLASVLTKQETGEVYNLLGEVEASLKNHQAAVRYLERALELEATEAHLFDLGYQVLGLWMLDRAVSVFRSGTEQFPTSMRMWMGLGSAYFAQAKNEEAVSAYLRATELGDDPRAYRFLGMVYLATNVRRADVAARFRRYRLARPQDAWANFYDGYCLSRGASPEEATPLLRRAIELDPKLAEAHFELGHLSARKGQLQEALASYQAAVKVNSQYQEAYYRLGQTYARVGRRAEADAALARHEELRQQQATNNDARLRDAILGGWD